MSEIEALTRVETTERGIDYTDRAAVAQKYPIGSHVRFNDVSNTVATVVDYGKFGGDCTLLVAPVVALSLPGPILEWHPGNVTRVRRVERWEPI